MRYGEHRPTTIQIVRVPQPIHVTAPIVAGYRLDPQAVRLQEAPGVVRALHSGIGIVGCQQPAHGVVRERVRFGWDRVRGVVQGVPHAMRGLDVEGRRSGQISDLR